MAVAPVTLPPVLAAWSAAGISHLFLECPVSDLQAQVPKAAAPAVPPGVLADGFSRPKSAPGKNPPGRPEVKPDHSKVRATDPVAPGANDPVRPASPPPVESRRFVPLEQWPAPWQKAFAKTSPAPLLWTYHSLGLDMEGGADSKQRSTLLRRLIGQLNLPKGSSVFWPCAMPAMQPSGEQALVVEPDIFFSGITLLNPQLLILFGDQAVGDIGIEDKPACFSQTLVGGKLLVLLPDLEQLTGDAGVNSVVSFMRAALAAISFRGV